jgi:hypothetical protein
MNGNGYQFPGDTADLVTISLHRAVAPFDLLTSFQNIPLDTSGYCHLPVPGNLASNYYIAMKHRNSVETWSSTPVSFATTGTVFFDFSNSFGSAFGNNLKPANGVFLLYSGDVNQDGLVDSSDMIIVDNDAMFFITGYLPGDLNGDGLIDSSDMIILDNNASSFVARIIPD